MILYKNRLIFGIFKNLFVTLFTIIYKIFALFNLQLTLLFALVGVLLYFTGVFEQNPAILILFYVLLIISIAYAILATIKKMLGIDKKIKKSKGAQIISTDAKEEKEETADSNANVVQEEKVVAPEKPTYFRVKNHPDYVMAEYSDRYELFKKTEDGLKRIRTDYKQ